MTAFVEHGSYLYLLPRLWTAVVAQVATAVATARAYHCELQCISLIQRYCSHQI